MSAMWQVRFGSCSRRSITPLIPSLSRLKSMMRYLWYVPLPWWRVVMRPTLLRPEWRVCLTTNGSCGPPFHRCDLSSLTTKRVPGEVGFILMTGISLTTLGLQLGFVVDRLAGGQANVSFLDVLRTALDLAHAARLAGLVHHVHVGDFHVEHELDRGLDLRLGRITQHAERVRVVVLHRERRLFGDVRRDEDVDQTLGARHLLRGVLDVDNLLRGLGGL